MGTPPTDWPNGENDAVRRTAIEERIRELALSFPETYEDHPWGDFPVFKVGANKVFAWLTIEPKAVQLTLKLTAEEREVAHLLPWVSIARYVGRYGWVTATVTDEDSLAAALEWLRESYWLKAPAAVRGGRLGLKQGPSPNGDCPTNGCWDRPLRGQSLLASLGARLRLSPPRDRRLHRRSSLPGPARATLRALRCG